MERKFCWMIKAGTFKEQKGYHWFHKVENWENVIIKLLKMKQDM